MSALLCAVCDGPTWRHGVRSGTRLMKTALPASAMMAVFTFRSDDKLTEPHWLYYTSLFLQALGLSLLTACSLNMAAHGDVAFEALANPKPVVTAQASSA